MKIFFSKLYLSNILSIIIQNLDYFVTFFLILLQITDYTYRESSTEVAFCAASKIEVK